MTVTIRSTFDRIDLNKDTGLSTNEVSSMISKAGLSGAVGSEAVKEFMTRFDADRNSDISRPEWRKGLVGSLFKHIKDANGRTPQPGHITEAVMPWFEARDLNNDGMMSIEEVRPWILSQLQRSGEDHAEQRADAGSRILTEIVDESGDNKVSRAELESLVRDMDGRR